MEKGNRNTVRQEPQEGTSKDAKVFPGSDKEGQDQE